MKLADPGAFNTSAENRREIVIDNCAVIWLGVCWQQATKLLKQIGIVSAQANPDPKASDREPVWPFQIVEIAEAWRVPGAMQLRGRKRVEHQYANPSHTVAVKSSAGS